LNPDIRTHITRQTPPTFLLQAEDDHVDSVYDSLAYYIWAAAHEVSDYGMASVGGDVAGDDRDDFGVIRI
jgi:hypothetical protein